MRLRRGLFDFLFCLSSHGKVGSGPSTHSIRAMIEGGSGTCGSKLKSRKPFPDLFDTTLFTLVHPFIPWVKRELNMVRSYTANELQG